MSEPEDCKGVCAREAFEMPEGCPPVSKPNVIDVVACTLPELEPTDFEQHPLVVDMPVVPFNVACTCLDVQTNLVVKDDRHTSNKASFRQASGPGGQDCCMGLYALDLELNIPTCSSDPPNITGSGSRGITVSGKGIPRQDEPCMFDLDMNIDVPCPLSDISIGDGQGIAEIEKEEDPDNCKLSFDVKVPCPLPGITFTVTGQASGGIVTGGAGSIGADGNNSTVDSGGDGGGRIGGNTVFASSLAYARGASGGSGGASGASGGGGGGGGADCKLELRLNVPCQLPGVSFVVNGQASGGIKTAPSPSGSKEECKTDLEINVPCQLPNIQYKVRGYVNFDENVPGTDVDYDSLDCAKFFNLEVPCQLPNISVNVSGQASGAIVPHPVSSETITSEECDAAISINVPCQLPNIDLSVTGQASGSISSGDESDDCSRSISINVPCQLPNIDLSVTGEASGSISSGDESDDCSRSISINVPCQLPGITFTVTGEASGGANDSDNCSKSLTIDVPCQLDNVECSNKGDYTDWGSDPPYDPNGSYNPYQFVRLLAPSHYTSKCGVSIPLAVRDFKVPVTKVASATGDNAIISVTPSTPSGSNITTYTLGPGTKMKKRKVYIPSGLTFSINSTTKKLEIKITRTLCTLWSDSDSQFGSSDALTGSVDVGECT